MARKLLAVVVVVAVAALAFVAGRVTLRPPDPVTPVPEQSMTVKVGTQTVERSLTLTTTVQRQTRPVAVNALAGIVTDVPVQGKAEIGKALYSVGGRPVVALQGSVPFHRALGPDTKGSDVRQVQQSLVALGFDLEATGKWTNATTLAVKAWQKRSGYPVTGQLELGEAIAFPTLPASVVVDRERLWPGASLAGGEALLKAYTGQPSFEMTLTGTQAELVTPGTEVRIQSGELTWAGITGEPTKRDDVLVAPVTAPDGGLPCADACDRLPVAEKSTLLTNVLVVPPASGPVVPVSALKTAPDGTSKVTVVEGAGSREQQVTVRQIANGLAVVDGVAEGTTVKVFGGQ